MSSFNESQLIYLNIMNHDSSSCMLIDDEEQLDYCDFSLNDTPQDQFLYLLDLAIEYGDINYIKQAINEYKEIIQESYIVTANNIMIQLLEEQIDDMSL